MLIYKIIQKLRSLYRNYEVSSQNKIIKNNIKKSGGKYGKNVVFGHNVVISGFNNFIIGNNSSIGSNAFVRAEGGLEIGDNVVISRNLVLYTSSHNYKGNFLPFDDSYLDNAVKIEDNVWIGMNVTISPGTIIREGAIIGLGSRIFGEIAKNSIVGSCPPKIIKQRDNIHYENLKKNLQFADKDGMEYNG